MDRHDDTTKERVINLLREAADDAGAHGPSPSAASIDPAPSPSAGVVGDGNTVISSHAPVTVVLNIGPQRWYASMRDSIVSMLQRALSDASGR